MAEVGIRELLEAGVHFGHQTRRWNPKMRRFIFGERVVPGLVRELRSRAVEVGDDTLGDEAVDHVVEALLEHEDVLRFEIGAAVEHEPPKHASEDEELGDDVARRKTERLTLASVITDERRQRAAAAQTFRLRMEQVLRELGNEGRHVAELADAAEPGQRRNRVVPKPLLDDGHREIPGLGPDFVGEPGEGFESRGGPLVHTGVIGVCGRNLS